jgi:hypothetical protein
MGMMWMTNQHQLSSFLKHVSEHITRLLSNFAVEHPSEFSVTEAMNMQSFVDKLSKMSISNTNKHHSNTTNPYFHSVRYGVDIIMRLYFLLNSVLSDILSMIHS